MMKLLMQNINLKDKMKITIISFFILTSLSLYAQQDTLDNYALELDSLYTPSDTLNLNSYSKRDFVIGVGPTVSINSLKEGYFDSENKYHILTEWNIDFGWFIEGVYKDRVFLMAGIDADGEGQYFSPRIQLSLCPVKTKYFKLLVAYTRNKIYYTGDNLGSPLALTSLKVDDTYMYAENNTLSLNHFSLDARIDLSRIIRLRFAYQFSKINPEKSISLIFKLQ